MEQTNLDGGILVGNVSREVELRVYDDGGSNERRAMLLDRLVEKDKVQFLLGGGPGSTQAMIDARGQQEIVLIANSEDDRGWVSEGERVFSLHPEPTIAPTMEFVRSARNIWGLKRMAIVWGTQQESIAHCTSVLRAIRSEALDVEIVVQTAVPAEQSVQKMKEVSVASVDFMVACVETEAAAALLVRGAAQAEVIKGFSAPDDDDGDFCTQRVKPAIVEAAATRFLFFSGGASNPGFYQRLQGWAHNALAPVVWHTDLALSDPYLGSSSEVNELWKGRADMGHGEGMSASTAEAVAAGVVLRLAIEAAGSADAADVERELDAMDAETLYGRVKFNEGGVNEGIQSPVVQWDCGGGDTCVRRVRDLGSMDAEGMRMLPVACPKDYVRADVGTSAVYSEVVIGKVEGEISQIGGAIEGTQCVQCMVHNASLLTGMMKDADSWDYLVRTCTAFSDIVRDRKSVV